MIRSSWFRMARSFFGSLCMLTVLAACESEEPARDDVAVDVGADAVDVADVGLDPQLEADAETETGATQDGRADPVEDIVVRVDCREAPFGLPCCDEAGARLGGSECIDGAQVCHSGSLCECQGLPIRFGCSDFCGSDIAGEAECTQDGWLCTGITSHPTDECPPDTCWGEPGECACCLDDGHGNPVWPDCVEGEWTCPQGAAFCVDCR